MRTLKEQCIYLHQFRSLEEAHQVIGQFIARYNTEQLTANTASTATPAARAVRVRSSRPTPAWTLDSAQARLPLRTGPHRVRAGVRGGRPDLARRPPPQPKSR